MCLWNFIGREWVEARSRIEAGRAAYRARERRRGRSRAVYPIALAPIGDFPKWLVDKVRGEIAKGVELPAKVMTFAFPPSPRY